MAMLQKDSFDYASLFCVLVYSQNSAFTIQLPHTKEQYVHFVGYAMRILRLRHRILEYGGNRCTDLDV